ncbi:MAG: hypothetical protein RQ748_03270, partial [Elusimicrobiales bacterium]|nr:hypothetical protein [Elusimicrobiales bacterium]
MTRSLPAPEKALLALLLCLPAGADARNDDILMGSVVKSDSWSMDRNTDTEHFKGDVSFSNPGYSLRADEAVYYRGIGEWSVKGSVAIRRLLEDGSTLDLFCERGRYAEDGERAELFSGAEPVRSVYTAPDGRRLKAFIDAGARKAVIIGMGYIALEM